MLWFFQWSFPVLWLVFLVYWQIRSANTKTTVRLEGAVSRVVRSIVFLIAVALLLYWNLPPFLYRTLVPQSVWTFFAGVAVALAGLLFAIWAREQLGRNWSRSVTLKEGHELVTSGPYAVVRHPIYTGILTGFLGSALAEGQLRSLIAFVLVFLVLFAKLRLEEQWMRAQFGNTYAAYSQRVAALVPFVL
jgi:protein-S-isoprenylcysteine O-methyltransferase Ste14